MRNKEHIPHIVQDKQIIIGILLKYKISTVCQFIKRKKEQKRKTKKQTVHENEL